jgi:excisionase family DNA binding protein
VSGSEVAARDEVNGGTEVCAFLGEQEIATLVPTGWKTNPRRTLMTGPVELPKLLSIDELAETLGVTHRHVRRLVDERRVPFLKVGKFVRFDPAAILAWLEESRVAASPPS